MHRTKPSLLSESDRELRRLERLYKQEGTLDTGMDYADALRRAGRTREANMLVSRLAGDLDRKLQAVQQQIRRWKEEDKGR